MSLPYMRKPSALCFFAVFLALFSCVLLAETPSTPKAEPGTGLEGVIMAGPIQGGPTRQGVPDSRPLPNTEFVVTKGEVPAVISPKLKNFSNEIGVAAFIILWH